LSKSARELATLIDDDKFQNAFSAPKAQLEQLLDAKTITIARLMDLVPVGTIDPTPVCCCAAIVFACSHCCLGARAVCV
jgi:hypothetical protein